MESVKQIIGSNIRTYRKEKGFSQEELAEKAALHRTYIGSVERGERNISVENIVSIARALNKLPKELLEGIE
ncbi:MAG: XRE family transcriptional regulator [Candidatus Electrothrix sp. AUS1_2]|nr:XRE family transcriptional regulator [Candidatus Electrothrix sp. AUS1_2]